VRRRRIYSGGSGDIPEWDDRLPVQVAVKLGQMNSTIRATGRRTFTGQRRRHRLGSSVSFTAAVAAAAPAGAMTNGMVVTVTTSRMLLMMRMVTAWRRRQRRIDCRRCVVHYSAFRLKQAKRRRASKRF